MQLERRILDVRSTADFERLHLRDAVNIPLEELADRIHELPSPWMELTVFDIAQFRSETAAELLRIRGRDRVEIWHGESRLTVGECFRGPASTRLWSPHTLLVQALDLMAKAWGTLKGRLALDLACGTGRDAVYMAMQGLKVNAWDNLPDALERCARLAARNGVSIHTECRDVERSPVIPSQAFDVVTCFNFLHRPLMPPIRDCIKPGGFVVYETFTLEQQRRFGKPKSDAHLLNPDELRQLFDGCNIIHYDEHLAAPRRFVASMIARRP